MTDNVIISHEIMHSMNCRRGTTGYMTLKIDMAKAYDKVEWSILSNILSLMALMINL